MEIKAEAGTGSKRKAELIDLLEDEDVVEMGRSAPAPPNGHGGQPIDPGGFAGDSSDDELVVTGMAGALVDFPHARENCARHAFRKGVHARNLVYCVNCFCYVCDVPALQCSSWQSHCDATHADRAWRDRRVAHQSGGAAAPPPAAFGGGGNHAPAGGWRGGGGGLPAPPPAPPPRLSRADVLATYSCEAVLASVVRVHPVEARAPAAIRATLRHYQKQSLAFMLAVERGEDPTLARAAHTTSAVQRFALGDDAKAAGAAGGAAAVDVSALRAGGWLCDSMGMGKTLVCAALVAADKEPGAARAPAGGAREIATTVVFVAVSLLGQWEDELRKHAPTLAVAVLEKNGRFTAALVAQLVGGAFDLVLTTRSVSQWAELAALGQPLDRTAAHFRRVIYDEAHTLPSVKTAQFMTVQAVRSAYRWAVTGTPFTSAVKELEAQAEFVGQWRGGVHLASWVSRFDAGRTAATLANLAGELKRVMMRHTKEQQIAGGAALALPSQAMKTRVLDMTPAERAEYAAAVAYEDVRLAELSKTGAKALTLQAALRTRLQLCAHVAAVAPAAGGPPLRPPEECTKLRALRDALRAKRAAEPRMHAVVFTQHAQTHALIVGLLRRDGFRVLAFSGATEGKRRHEFIRNFQQGVGAPAADETGADAAADDDDDDNEDSEGLLAKVFVITLKAGAVGITLTAADVVYLMEPCLDPATELQAAGRIHRLGQARAVTVHRFVFRDTVEESVRELHEKIKSGQITVADSFFTPAAVKLLASR